MALLWVQAEAHRRGEAIPEAVGAEAVAREASRLDADRAIAVMAFVGSVPVAGCHGEPARQSDGTFSDTIAHLSGVSVHPDWWGRGIAGAMLIFMLEQLRASGFTDVQLWVLETNARARRLYERIGWRLVRLGAFHRDGPHAVYDIKVSEDADPA